MRCAEKFTRKLKRNFLVRVLYIYISHRFKLLFFLSSFLFFSFSCWLSIGFQFFLFKISLSLSCSTWCFNSYSFINILCVSHTLSHLERHGISLHKTGDRKDDAAGDEDDEDEDDEEISLECRRGLILLSKGMLIVCLFVCLFVIYLFLLLLFLVF